MNFKRFDPLNEYIRTAYGRCVNNCYSFEQAEIELDNHKTNPINRAGIGFFMIDIAPNKARGYLAAYDALNALGYDYDSELILKKYISKKGFHILMAVRLINRYIDKSFFDDAINVINLAKNEIYKYLESNASLRLRISSMYKTMCLVHEYEELSCDRDFFRRTEYAELFEKLTASSFQEQNSLIKDLIESENSISAAIGFWIALNSGNKTEDFFSIAVKNLITENDSAARLIYFRIRAREEFSDNYSFVDLSIQSFLHRSEIGRAERVISELLSRGKYDSNILNHAVRVSALTGFLDRQIISDSDWKGYSQEKSYLLQRQLSIAKWQGDSEKFSRIYSSTRCNNLFEFRGFIHDNFFQRNKKKISVALLVSGQLRGSEQLIKENITLLSKQLNADVFMDVWDEQVLSPPRFNRVVRFLGGELYDRLPEEAKTPVVFQKLLPSVFKKLTTPIKKYVNSEGLMQSYSALTARVEDQKIFESFCENACPGLKFRNVFNQAKMFYKIFQANEGLEAYEKKIGNSYDVVLRTRPDLKLILPNLNDLIDAVYKNKDVIYVGYVNNVGFCDQFAIGSRAAMRVYSEVWEKILEVNSFRYSPILDKWSLHAAEALLACHLTAAGLRVRVINPTYHNLVTPLIINEIDISSELENDIEKSTSVNFSEFYEYYSSKKKINYLFR